MKMAFLSFYSGKIDRGVEVAVEALAEGLSKNHQVTLFQTGNRDKYKLNRIILNVNCDSRQDESGSVRRIWYLDYYSKKIAYFTLKFIPYFIRNKYDLVIPTNGGWQVLICRLLTWIFGKKMLVQGNAGIGRDDLWQLICCPDHYIAISPQGYEWVKRKVTWVKKSYIPYGVDLNKIIKTKPKKISLLKPIALCVSAFLPYKQIDLAIKAVSFLKNVSFLLIGHGPQKEYLYLLGKKLLGNRFMMLSDINHDELLGYYKAVDLFTLPSQSSEAFGIVYIEAMASGLPIVAPDDYNRRQIIGEYGFFVDPKDTYQYGNKIKEALRIKNSNKMLNQAKKYSWNIILDKYENLLKTL